ncbi:MAG: TonB-dependent receptor [Bacteroidota bacterium]|nr:TonB-dependent receptor [Bacteroidota bacterium]
MKKLFTKFFVIALLCFASSSLFAQASAGKLAGKVTDAATGEPLIGANIVVQNTNLGSASNVDGDYYILNIAPGTYDVKISYVGYAPKVIQGVRIIPSVTQDLNIQLTAGLTTETVEVLGKKLIETGQTNTQKVIDADEISRLPVQGVERLASLQAGVVMSEGSGGAEGNANINVRGGRSSEVLYIVDGVPQNDVYTGSNYSQISNAAIEQLSFQIGGYEAKYGQAQSGVITVTTKAGDPNYSIYLDGVTSSFTDKYGYNTYTGDISGPIIPGNANNTFFVSVERGWYLDADPKAVNFSFNSNVKRQYDILPDNSSSVWRYTARTNHSFGNFQLKLGANINSRDFRTVTELYAKNNSMHNPLTKRLNSSFSARLSQTLGNASFWNLNVGYRLFDEKSGDGVWFDNLTAYGDSVQNAKMGVTLTGNGNRITTDNTGIFYDYGRVSNSYTRTNNKTINVDADFSSQVSNHLLELGGGMNYNVLRVYAIAPAGLDADNLQQYSIAERYRRMQPTAFGYDVTGKNETSIGSGDNAPKTPVIAYAYAQDKFELNDLVLNLGLRLDYFDTQTDILRDPALPYAAGDPNAYDAADFTKKKPEFYISPRIGLGFPITQNTVFHAQYGKFIQQPPLNNLYTTTYNLNFLITDNNWNLNTGHVNSEITTQYEIGFRHMMGEVAAVNITAFYKNTEGLLNTAVVFYQRQEGGQTLKYITPTNSDFGTIKGISLALDVTRISYFSASLNYTYSLAEGTGSSTSSSFVAAFRNTNGEIPKVIAPLDFDQRHTGVINLDFYVPKDNLGIFELLNANVLVSFNSGRPYTPVVSQNLIAGYTNYGDTKGYVNSAYGPGNFRIDLKLEKGFTLANNVTLTPYVWIENLLDSKNVVNVWRSTGDAYTTAWLNTSEAQKIAQSKADPQSFIEDYKSLERDPYNFGIPRMIKVGLKVNFAKIQL